jgi:hypothetical protein
MILLALKERMLNIKEANGYPVTIKTVTFEPKMSMNYNNNLLPLIEIINGDENYKINSGGTIEVDSEFIFRLVCKKSTTDDEMSVIKGCLMRCLFSNSYNNKINGAIYLPYNGQNLILNSIPLQTVTDLNMLEANRIWNLIYNIRYIKNIMNM